MIYSIGYYGDGDGDLSQVDSLLVWYLGSITIHLLTISVGPYDLGIVVKMYDNVKANLGVFILVHLVVELILIGIVSTLMYEFYIWSWNLLKPENPCLISYTD